MEFDTIVQFISSVGFPIVMCLCTFSYMKEKDKAVSEEIRLTTQSINNLCNKIDILIDRKE